MGPGNQPYMTLWDSIFAVGMFLSALVFFRRFFNENGVLGKFLTQQSYAVYVTHIPVIVFLAYVLRSVVLVPLIKLSLASLIAVITCFALAYLIRKNSGVSKVL